MKIFHRDTKMPQVCLLVEYFCEISSLDYISTHYLIKSFTFSTGKLQYVKVLNLFLIYNKGKKK